MILFPRAAAKNPATNPSVLERLSQSENPRVIELVAANTSTPRRALERLAAGRNLKVRAVVAGNTSTPADVLASLAADRNEAVRLAVASNESASSAALDSLLSQLRGAGSPSGTMRVAVARNENASPALLSNLAKDPSAEVQVAVATNRATPLSARAELFKKAHLRPLIIATGHVESPAARVKVAQSHQYSRPSGVLEVLAHDADVDVRRAVAAAPDTGPELLTTLCSDRDARVVAVAKAASEKDPTELSRMAGSTDELVLSVVRRNPGTPVEVKGALAVRLLPNSDVETLRQIARDETTPSEVLNALASHADRSVRFSLASRGGLPTQAQVRLAGDPLEEIRKAVAVNATTQPLLLTRLASDSSPEVRQEVAKNASTPPEVFTTLATDKDPEVQVAIAGNQQAPQHALALIAANGHQPRRPGWGRPSQTTYPDKDDPRVAVASNPNAPAEALRVIAGSRSDLHGLLLRNPATPGDVIDQLTRGLLVERAERRSSRTRWVPTGDENEAEGMLWAVQGNPSTPDETLRFLLDAAWVRDRTTRVPYREDGHTFWKDELDEKATAAARAALRREIDEELRRRQLVRRRSSLPLERRVELAGKENPQEILLELAHDGAIEVRRAVAHNYYAKAGVLAHLACDESTEIRAAVARHFHTGAEIRAQLARDRSVEVRQAIARHGAPELLTQLAQDESPEVRRAVARQHWTKPQVLKALAEDGDAEVRAAVASHSSDRDVLSRFAMDEEVDVRLALAANTTRDVMPDVLTSLATDGSPKVRAAIISNAFFWGCPLQIGELLASDPEPSVRKALSQSYLTSLGYGHNGKAVLSESALVNLVASGTDKFRRAIARDNRTPREVLTRLAEHEDPETLEGVAGHPYADADVLARLARSRDTAVLAQIAKRWISLTWADPRDDRDTALMMALAENPRTPADVLTQFARSSYDHGDREIALAAVRNPAFPEQALLDLAEGQFTDPQILRMAAEKRSATVRAAIAANAGTPPDVLAALASDPYPGIRNSLLKNPNTPAEALIGLIDGSDDK
ncbi:variant leucine-rich repeat-containing protein [Cellulomonas xiejunii]|uniref:Leucine rich repeat variant domain-containing protein n=1 Tax=Cellulomonas xiejunii TaxID=2968083 RepID=A0ABY5KQF1_9CELL|nr:hypothetical protein [Cellulomonas xiejunii]MCC2321358.1 hypothetical protein [Cellulomonas xiejunii]UUI71943.1 hypothetical protein NP048_00240 [Cellulomonas xiejunii]